MKKVKGIGQWAGKDVPGMYQKGGDISLTDKPKGKSNPPKGDISIKSKGDISVKPGKGSKTGLDAMTKSIKNVNPAIKKKLAKKAVKKVGTKFIPFVGQAIAAAQIYKEIKSGGKGIKKNIKNVKDFAKTGDWGHILEGKSSKKPKKPVKKTIKKKDTKLQSMKKGEYKPQSRK